MRELRVSANGSPTPWNVREAKDFFSRLKGFMFSKAPDFGLLLLNCRSVHTFFMRFNLDLIFLDRQNKIVRIHRNVSPWNLILPVSSASHVLELPSGAFDVSALRPGNELSLVPSGRAKPF